MRFKLLVSPFFMFQPVVSMPLTGRRAWICQGMVSKLPADVVTQTNCARDNGVGVPLYEVFFESSRDLHLLYELCVMERFESNSQMSFYDLEFDAACVSRWIVDHRSGALMCDIEVTSMAKAGDLDGPAAMTYMEHLDSINPPVRVSFEGKKHTI